MLFIYIAMYMVLQLVVQKIELGYTSILIPACSQSGRIMDAQTRAKFRKEMYRDTLVMMSVN